MRGLALFFLPTLLLFTLWTSSAVKGAEEVVTNADGSSKVAIRRTQVTTDVLQAFSDAWNAHDLEKLLTFMSDDCEFYAVAGPELQGKRWIGKEEVKTGFSQAFINFPDAQWIDPVHFVMPVSSDSSELPRGVTESTFVGTRTTPDGQKLRIEARMVDVFTFNDEGKIRIKNAFRKDRPPQTVV